MIYAMKIHFALKKNMNAVILAGILCAMGFLPTTVSAAGILPSGVEGVQPPAVAYDITVDGSPEFNAQAKKALDLLTACAPNELQRADIYLESIQYADRSGMLVHSGIFQASSTTAFAPGYSAEVQAFWFAGTIVHDAHHAWQEANGIDSDNWSALTIPERQHIEADARNVQISVLKKCLPAISANERPNAEFMVQYLESMQDDDANCDYCEVEYENRTW